MSGPAATGPRREDVLGGLSGRRASTIEFAILARTAVLATEARYATAPAVCDRLAEVDERALLTTLATGRRGELDVAIQDLERFAPAWAHLVPADPGVRAELARRLSERHRFRASDVPRLRAALGLDDGAVERSLVARGIDVGHERLTIAERWTWSRSRLRSLLEDLPPFWTSYALTLTQTIGAGILALPIALGAIGPLPGLAVLALLGVINLLTITAVAETFVRTGSVRWEGAFLGRVVTGYLGRTAGAVFSGALVLFSASVLLVYYLGFASTLADATGAHGMVFAAVLFGAAFVLVARGRLGATVATSLAVGAVNLTAILVLSFLALRALDPQHLMIVDLPFVGGSAMDAGLLELVFGVILLAYFGHTSVANGARLVLRRAPDGRALMAGAKAALLTAMVLYGVWVVAIGGAVPRDRLVEETGTALTPLAEVAGPAVLPIGLVFVVLAMGMASVQFSIGLHAQARELVERRMRGAAAQVVAFTPIVVVFACASALLWTGRGSFTGALSLIGTMLGPLLAGVFPVLLLAASRRRGDQLVARARAWLAHPLVLGTLYLVFLLAIVLHGAVVWTGVTERIVALAVVVGVVALTVSAANSGAFRPTASIELRRDAHLGTDHLRLVAGGRAADALVAVTDRRGEHTTLPVAGTCALPPGTTRVEIPLADLPSPRLHLWIHATDPTGANSPLTPTVTLATAAAGEHAVQLAAGRASVVAPDGGTLRIVLATAAPNHPPLIDTVDGA